MDAKKVFVCILAAYLLGFFAHAAYLGKTVYGDGIYYYSWLRSVVADRDINFGNDYTHFGATQPLTPLNVIGNKYAIGPALLWTPTFLLTHTVMRGTGWELPYQLAVGVASILYGVFGLLLLYLAICKHFGETVSLFTILALAFCTNLLFYGSLDTVNSHAVSFFAAALFVTLLFGTPKKHWVAIGMALGLIALIRLQDVVYGLLLIPYLNRKSILRLASGFIPVLALQLIAWQLLYGKFWVSPYILGGEGFTFLRPAILGVLFSPEIGLFLITPMALIGCVGLWAHHPRITFAKTFRLLIILQIYLVASWSTWWQGASYSGRMFVASLPLLAFGIANVFVWLGRLKWKPTTFYLGIIGPLGVINGLLIVYFLASH